MKILSIIVINDNIVKSIDSFGVYEEQLSDDVKDVAEKHYIEKCKEFGFIETAKLTEDELICYGFYIAKNGTTINYVVSYIY